MMTINFFKILKSTISLDQFCTFRKSFIPTHIRRFGPVGFATPLHLFALNTNYIFLSNRLGKFKTILYTMGLITLRNHIFQDYNFLKCHKTMSMLPLIPVNNLSTLAYNYGDDFKITSYVCGIMSSMNV